MAVIDAKQERDVMTIDVPNAFVQTPIPKGEKKIIMKMTGQLVDIMIELFFGEYNEFVIYE